MQFKDTEKTFKYRNIISLGQSKVSFSKPRKKCNAMCSIATFLLKMHVNKKNWKGLCKSGSEPEDVHSTNVPMVFGSGRFRSQFIFVFCSKRRLSLAHISPKNRLWWCAVSRTYRLDHFYPSSVWWCCVLLLLLLLLWYTS